MKKALIITLVLVMVLTVALTGCNSAPAAESSAAGSESAAATTETSAAASTAASEDAGGAKKIAYLAPSFNTPFWVYCEDGIKDVCSKQGWEVVSYDSNNEAATQLKNAQNAIASGVSAIVISPTDSASCPAVLEEAKNANVPVVICDIGTDSGDYLTLIATPNEAGAYKVGEYFTKYVKEHNLTGVVGEITVPLARINGQNRQKGFQKALDEAGITKTTVLESSDFSVDEAYGQAKNIVSANPDLMAIWSHHSQATLGVVKALDELGLSDKILVACFDGDPDIIDYLKEGKILVCGAQQPIKMGREAVNALIASWDGETVEKEIPVDVLLLTADTVNDQIDDIVENVCPVNE
ncbi:MAG: substrate-binding domain-containing protein [Christensenella sp.]|nr:substrate-binding domain-containing protein [Christensenella sp.]